MGKFSELLEVSEPKQVILNAKKYFNNPNVTIYLSPEKNKKYAVINPYTNKLISFGQMGYKDYTRTPYITITDSLTNYLGFTSSQYPATLPYTSNYSLLSNKTPPIATNVNSIIIHSSLVNNNVVSPSDILDAFQITNTTFGANINYAPTVPKWVKLSSGSFSNFYITFADQNLNLLAALDNNILITLLFRLGQSKLIKNS